MTFNLRRSISLILSLCLAVCLLPPVQARAAASDAQDISSPALVTSQVNLDNWDALFDKDIYVPLTIHPRTRLTLEHPEGIGSIYTLYDLDHGPCTITDNATGRTYRFGMEGFLHDFWDLEAAFGYAPASISIRFPEGEAQILEMYLFSSGEVPAFVQKWSVPREAGVDLMLFSTHGDDEQLFFAGMLPYYAGELGYEVLVVYLTDHRNATNIRCHEMLDGLWAVGVTSYPVLGKFGDFYCKSANQAYRRHLSSGETDEALLGYVVEQLRRYQPKVAVGHDLLYGEYGHGQHMMYADLLCRGVDAALDPAQYPHLAAKWGTWDVPKTYLHLWRENPITMDWDQPLSKFGGLTAFQVSKDLGFPCHVSQQENFAWYIASHDSAASIKLASPCAFGLYRSTVGMDTGRGDFFENLTPYAP